MNLEDLIGMETNAEVYNDGNLVIYLGYDRSGNIWFHHDIKEFTKEIFDNRFEILEGLFNKVKTVMKVDRMYSWCPDDATLKWASFCGWDIVQEAVFNGQPVTIVEYK